MLITIFLLILPSNQITCNTNEQMITGYSDNNDLHFAVYVKEQSNKLFLFMGSIPGGSAMFYEHYGDFKELGTLLFLDVEGAGYSKYTGKVTTIQGLAQAYADALNQLIKCLPPFEELIVVTGGIMSKVAIQLKDKNIPELKAFILLSPILDIKINIKYLPTMAFNMGLIDYQERMELESYILALPNPTFQQYLILLNKIVKYSGDMQHYDYRKYETDTLNLDLTNYMNSEDIRKIYSASSFFYTQNQQLYTSIQDSLNQQIDLNLSKYKFLFFLPQFSLAVNIPGTMAYLNQYIKDDFKLHISDDAYPLYAQKGPIFLIQDCGDRIYIDKPILLKQLIQANIKI